MPADTASRIKAIQKILGLPEDGIPSEAGAKKLLEFMGRPTSGNLTTLVKRIQQELGVGDDGIFGPATLTRLEAFLAPAPVSVKNGSLVVSKASLNMIIGYEVSSKENYDKKLQSPILPAGASGITIGIGYDLGHNSAEQIRTDWNGIVSDDVMMLLTGAAGLKAGAAQAKMPAMKNIKISYDGALKVYYMTTVPRYAALTRKTFPGVEKLPPDAQGAILSLVFNRGASLKAGDGSRTEMAAMVPLIKAGDLKGIAAQFRSMKRLWQGKPGLAGLLKRRDKEADMIEKATFNILPENQIVV